LAAPLALSHGTPVGNHWSRCYSQHFLLYTPRRVPIRSTLIYLINLCQFHQHFTHTFFVQKSFRQLFSSLFWIWQKYESTFVQKYVRKTLMKLTLDKNCFLNDGDIDASNQFHQHFTSSFCTDFLLLKNYKPILYSKTIKASQNTFVQKAALKIMMKLTLGFLERNGHTVTVHTSIKNTYRSTGVVTEETGSKS